LVNTVEQVENRVIRNRWQIRVIIPNRQTSHLKKKKKKKHWLRVKVWKSFSSKWTSKTGRISYTYIWWSRLQTKINQKKKWRSHHIN
jgi:hypothetical protein